MLRRGRHNRRGEVLRANAPEVGNLRTPDIHRKELQTKILPVSRREIAHIYARLRNENKIRFTLNTKILQNQPCMQVSDAPGIPKKQLHQAKFRGGPALLWALRFLISN